MNVEWIFGFVCGSVLGATVFYFCWVIDRRNS